MPEINPEIVKSKEIKVLRKYLKLKILEDNVTFRNHFRERNHICDLIKRTVVHGESHSALLIGPRGCGKTTLVNSVLNQLSKEVDMVNDAMVIKLNGLIHHDEKVALKSITAQMQLENAVGDRVFGTFAENLSFLLSCLASGTSRRCRSMAFLLEQFDMFCRGGRAQTLLYNLFDITHSQQAPVCVLGITNRIDVMELLEKRVKSRFSHRHIFLFPNEVDRDLGTKSPLEKYRERFLELLTVPVEKKVKAKRARKKSLVTSEDPMEVDQDIRQTVPVEVLQRCHMSPLDLDPGFAEAWNAHIKSLADDDRVKDALEKLAYYTVDEQVFRNVLFQLVSKLSPRKPCIDTGDLNMIIDNTVAPEHRVKLLQSLSILEFSLVIAMLHGMEIFDGQPMNFEMVLHRYTKFATANSSTQTVPRPVILKAFEHLQELEIVVPIRGDASQESTVSGVQREYKLHALAIPADEVRDAAKGFKALPTEISQWLNNHIE